MALPVGKSPIKAQETSMPKEKAVEPTPFQSMPLKEFTSKTAAEASALELPRLIYL
jgi:hypothetical protein